MQKYIKLKGFLMLVALMLASVWCTASDRVVTDGYSYIIVKQNGTVEAPKGYAIQASINGHMLSVAFIENLGQVSIEITTSTGGYVQANSCLTPNGLQFYISPAGDYIVTFTLPNGDEYYGEFTVND
ncbi:MAG: DUF3244 domain-containing protein [Bacteroidales bacterium]|nr:DUF3244 domain-containing protein [Bacteroidales bacterium]